MGQPCTLEHVRLEVSRVIGTQDRHRLRGEDVVDQGLVPQDFDHLGVTAAGPDELVDDPHGPIMLVDPIIEEVEETGWVTSARGHVLEMQIGAARAGREMLGVLVQESFVNQRGLDLRL
jgi:hypothetical protein